MGIIFPGAVVGGIAIADSDPVTFNGTGAFLNRIAGLGLSDSATGILSFWYKGSGVATRQLLSGQITTSIFDQNVTVMIDTTNNAYIALYNAAGSILVAFKTAAATLNNGSWHHVLAGWTTGGTLHMYLDGSSSISTSFNNSGNVDYSQNYWYVGRLSDGTRTMNGTHIAELYFHGGATLDFSVASNRRKFLTPNGKPADLGADGSKPLGVAPAVYLTNPAATFGTNSGSGGNFTLNGSFLDEGTEVTL